MTHLPLGTATLSPTTSAVAGKHNSWTITYTVGSYGIDSGGQIKIAMRIVTDWGDPQFTDPTAEGYSTVTVISEGAAKIRPSYDSRGYIRPFSKAITLTVYDGSLAPNDQLIIHLGDTSGGAPGLRAQTYIESAFEFRILVDPTNATDPRPIGGQPLTIPIIADDPIAIDCILPSQAAVDQPIPIFIKGEDLWRNPTRAPEPRAFQWHSTGRATIDPETQTLIVHEQCTGYLTATAGPFTGRSNPITIGQPQINRYWGDLHAQTAGTVGVGTDDEYFTFGRDIAQLDFMSHQGNDFQISDEYWAELNQTTQKYHEDGRFVVFPGYEWSASSPTGGDHNIFYRTEGHPILRSSHWLVPHVPSSDLSPAHPADVFYKKLKQTVPLDQVIVAQHVGGRYANLRNYFDQELITLVELVSVWGVFEWMLWDAFDKGYIVGVMANSDGHHGRPGAEGAGMSLFGIRNGLTCVLSPELTRNALFDALKKRHCYATTGTRMLLEFTADSAPMGSLLTHTPNTPIALKASVTGTGPLESLQLYQGRKLIAETRPDAFTNLTRSNRIRISWQGSRERGRQRRVVWDGTIHIEGAKILSAAPFSFDVVSDGITAQTTHTVTFASKTTGDRDGLDLILDNASQGKITFNSAAGTATVDLATLTNKTPRQQFDFGGVDMSLLIERYPESPTTTDLHLTHTITPPPNQRTPYLIKATQADGHMAWSSPIYINNTNSRK